MFHTELDFQPSLYMLCHIQSNTLILLRLKLLLKST